MKLYRTMRTQVPPLLRSELAIKMKGVDRSRTRLPTVRFKTRVGIIPFLDVVTREATGDGHHRSSCQLSMAKSILRSSRSPLLQEDADRGSP